MKSFNLILQALKDSNFLNGASAVLNGKIRCEFALLQNGLKLREQLLKQLLKESSNWSTPCREIGDVLNPIGSDQISFLQKVEFQKTLQNIYNEKLISMTNSVAYKIVFNKNRSSFTRDDLFSSSTAKAVLVTDVFVSAENDLYRYNNLQRERKVWWMNFSANPSRYAVQPCEISSGNDHDDVLKNSKSMRIIAKYTYGSAEVENIFLIPLYKSRHFKDFCQISLIRSVISLDLAASALILDSSVFRTNSRHFALMLNRKLAPYQILLANLHDRNTTVDELTTHIQHVIGRSDLRLYGNIIHSNLQNELEPKLLQFDGVGIPYILLIDDESTKSGFIRMRSRDTTLFETIHISDIPIYLTNIFTH